MNTDRIKQVEGQASIAYLVRENEKRYLCVIDDAGNIFYRLRIDNVAIARLAAECSASLVCSIHREEMPEFVWKTLSSN